MSFKEQIKQKVMKLAYKAEQMLHQYRVEHEEKNPPSPPTKKSTGQDPGQIRTYYNNSKEERKLH